MAKHTLAIGDLYTAAHNDTWTVVALLQTDVCVLRYETVASEPNWSGTEGYVVVQQQYGADGFNILEDGAQTLYTYKGR